MKPIPGRDHPQVPSPKLPFANRLYTKRSFNSWSLRSFLWLMVPLICAMAADAHGGWLEKGAQMLESLKSGKAATAPTQSEIGNAFKEALHIGTENVVGRLGKDDGFNADPAVHIPLPRQLNTVRQALDKVGMAAPLDDLELKLNRAAEVATPKAKKLFWQAITQMSFEDVKKIYNGPQDSATRYFQSKMTPGLSMEMRPIVENSLSQVGAVKSYDQVMRQYKSLPFVPDVRADLTRHVVDRGIAGIFVYLAKEEVEIRQNPMRQTTDLLKKVFGAK